MASLFVMGSAMATLQTAINPLLRVAGGEENFAFNSAFAQLVFGSASFLSPHMYSYMVLNPGQRRARRQKSAARRFWPKSLPTDCRGLPCIGFSPFSPSRWLSSFSSAVFRRVELSSDEQAVILTGPMAVFFSQAHMVWAFFLCVFAYVGSEQGTANWIS